MKPQPVSFKRLLAKRHGSATRLIPHLHIRRERLQPFSHRIGPKNNLRSQDQLNMEIVQVEKGKSGQTYGWPARNIKRKVSTIKAIWPRYRSATEEKVGGASTEWEIISRDGTRHRLAG